MTTTRARQVRCARDRAAEWWSRRPDRRAVVRAVWLACVVGAGTLVVTAARDLPTAEAALAVAAALAASALWAWHGRAPVASALLIFAVLGGYVVAGLPYGPIQLSAMVAAFAVARQRRARTALAVCGFGSLVLAGALWTRLATPHVLAAAAVLVAWPSVFVVIPGLAGALARARDVAATRERAELLARGAYEERLRVAREVHDIAGHGFAVTAMQAGVALTVLDDDPAQARKSLQAIRSSSDHALAELRATLDLLRGRQHTGADVTDLVTRVRATGLSVDLDIAGADEDPVPDTVYRVVQEALTNVVRHSGARSASVRLAHAGDVVDVRVADDGAGAGPASGPGLSGIRRRVEAAGGSMWTGNSDDGGFLVHASVPLSADSTPSRSPGTSDA